MQDVKVVINFDYPQSSEDYIHRIGRTGRLQQSGTSYAFFTPNNIRHASELISVLRETNQAVSPQLLEMAEIAKSDMMSKKSKSQKPGAKPMGFMQRGNKANGRGMSRGGMSRGGSNRGSFDDNSSYQGAKGPNRFGYQRQNNQRNENNGQGYYRSNDYGNQQGYDYSQTAGYGQGPPASQFNVPPPGYGAGGNQCVQYPIAY